MLTKNDLSSIQKLVRGEVRGAEERLGVKIVKVEEKVGGLEEKVGGLEEKVVKVQKNVQAVEKSLGAKIDKVQESVDIVQAVVVEHYGKLEQRVANIEDELNIPKNL